MPNIDRNDENATRYEVGIDAPTLTEFSNAATSQTRLDAMIDRAKRDLDLAEGYLHADPYDAEAIATHIHCVGVLATLRKYKAIIEAERPKIDAFDYEPSDVPVEVRNHIAALTAYAERMRVERDNAQLGENFHDAQATQYAQQVAHWIEKHDALKAELENEYRGSYGQAIELNRMRERAELAESQRDALVRLMREPDEEMRKNGAKAIQESGIAENDYPRTPMSGDGLVAGDIWQVMSAVALRKVMGEDK